MLALWKTELKQNEIPVEFVLWLNKTFSEMDLTLGIHPVIIIEFQIRWELSLL